MPLTNTIESLLDIHLVRHCVTYVNVALKVGRKPQMHIYWVYYKYTYTVMQCYEQESAVLYATNHQSCSDSYNAKTLTSYIISISVVCNPNNNHRLCRQHFLSYQVIANEYVHCSSLGCLLYSSKGVSLLRIAISNPNQLQCMSLHLHVSCEFQHLLFHSIFVLDLGHIVTNRVLTSFYFMVMRHQHHSSLHKAQSQ